MHLPQYTQIIPIYSLHTNILIPDIIKTNSKLTKKTQKTKILVGKWTLNLRF